MKKAVIKSGVVVNIIEADDSFRLPDATIVPATPETQMGGLWDGSVFSPPPAEPIARQRRRMVARLDQFRIALAEAGRLVAVETAVMADPRAAITWEYGGAIKRNSPLVIVAATAMTPMQMDTVFRAAMRVDI